MADFIEMDHAAMLRQIAELDKTLANLEKSVSGEIMDAVLHEAAEQLKDEQARILSGAPSDGIRSLAKDLSVWKDNRRPAPRKVSYRAGYSDDKINQSIKYFVTGATDTATAAIKKLETGLKAVLASAAGKKLYEVLIGSNAEMEQYLTSFEVMLGDARKANSSGGIICHSGNFQYNICCLSLVSPAKQAG